MFNLHKVLSPNFFKRPTEDLAKNLLGKFLVRRFLRHSASGPRKSARREMAAMITEVEAYIGPEDKASHASRGVTKRTKVMFGKPGQWYVYMIYGMYHCLNIVTERRGYPAAILIRSVEGVNGPGRVCKYFKIGRALNSKPADNSSGLWIEDRGVKISNAQIKRGKRIGIDYAGKWKYKLWRYYF